MSENKATKTNDYQEPPSQESLGKAARAWGAESTQHLTMVPELATEFARILDGDEPPTDFEAELTELLNAHCMENGSNSPDFILARYLMDCLAAFNRANLRRDKWYGIELSPGCTH